MVMETRELTCINCPLGCRLAVLLTDDGGVSVSGNGCPRGDAYGRAEVTDPRRIVTTTVPIKGSAPVRMLPVKTAGGVPKALVREVVAALADVWAQAPVSIGDVIHADVCGTGVDVVATRDVP